MDILCIGTLVADILVYPVNYVDFDLDLQLVEGIKIENGGDGMNVAVNLAKLSNRVGMIGRIGNDELGKVLVNRLESLKINTRGLIVDEGIATSSTIVLINNDGRRCFLFYGGANHEFKIEDINTKLLNTVSIVHISGFYQMPRFDGVGTAKIMRTAKAMGKITTLDVNWDHSGKWKETITETLKYIDYFIPSEEEAALITNQKNSVDIADALLNMGVKNVLIKMGNKGAYFKNRKDAFRIACHKVDAIDTTGAGDAFVGGFLTGLNKKWDIRKCARLGTAAAAFCVKKVGATSGIAKYKDIEMYMKNNPVDIY